MIENIPASWENSDQGNRKRKSWSVEHFVNIFCSADQPLHTSIYFWSIWACSIKLALLKKISSGSGIFIKIFWPTCRGRGRGGGALQPHFCEENILKKIMFMAPPLELAPSPPPAYLNSYAARMFTLITCAVSYSFFSLCGRKMHDHVRCQEKGGWANSNKWGWMWLFREGHRLSLVWVNVNICRRHTEKSKRIVSLVSL